MIDKLIKFVRDNYPGSEMMPDSFLKNLFERYEKTTLIVSGDNDEIRGVAAYQNWPNRAHFIFICGIGVWWENVEILMNGAEKLPHKIISFYDENKMRLIEWHR